MSDDLLAELNGGKDNQRITEISGGTASSSNSTGKDLTWDGPYVVERPGYTARMLIGQKLPETVEDADVQRPSPRRHLSLRIIDDHRRISKVLQRHRQTGETANGAYFWCTVLVIAPEAVVPAMIRAL